MACEECAHCDGSLSHGEAVVLKEYSYHKECHKCYVCSETNLRNAEVFKGVIFCWNCAQRILQSSTNRRTKRESLRSHDRELRGRTQKKRTSRRRPIGSIPVDRVIGLSKMTVSTDSSNKTFLEDVKTSSKTSATSKELQRQIGENGNRSNSKTKTIIDMKCSADTGTTTLITLKLLKQFYSSAVSKESEQPPPPSKPPSTKRTERKKVNKKHDSDLRIAELGASTEIAHVALRHKSEMPVIIQSETHVKEKSEESPSQSTTINQVSTDSSGGIKDWMKSSQSTIFESVRLIDRRIASILRMPIEYFKYNVLRRSSLVSVLLDPQGDSCSLMKKLNMMFHDEINEHKTRGIKRLYSTINRRKVPHKLGWLTLDKLVSRYSGPLIRSGLERKGHKRCKHFRNSHSYRCMRTQVMRLAGPTKSELACYRNTVKNLLLPNCLKLRNGCSRRHVALKSEACGRSQCYEN